MLMKLNFKRNLPPVIPCKAPFARPPTVPAAQPRGSENINLNFWYSKSKFKRVSGKLSNNEFDTLDDGSKVVYGSLKISLVSNSKIG